VITTVSGPDSVETGGSAPISCAATDPDNDSIVYTWSCSSGGLSSPNGAAVTWYAPASPGSATITVIASDGRGGCDTARKDVKLYLPPNFPPVINALNMPDSVIIGGTGQLSCSAADPDQDSLTYAWTCSAGSFQSPIGQTVTWNAPGSPGSAAITVIVSDGRGGSDTAYGDLRVYQSPNMPPVVDSIHGTANVNPTGSTTLTCFAHDPEGDSLTYSWSCTRGRLSSTSGRTVTWTAPDSSGSALVTVTVRDNHGGSDVGNKSITINRITTTLVRWDGALQAGYYIEWHSTIAIGYRVSGNFSVDAHDINFLILNATNYTRWVNNQSYTALVEYSRSAGASFSATIPATGTYYIILDNTCSLFTDKFCHITVQKTTP
jgi:hypothetical protein